MTMLLHLDVGYARVHLDGALDLATSGVADLEILGGAYQAHATVDAWLVEIGSQVEAWGVVFGFGFGLMGTFTAQTSINAVNGAPSSPSLGSAAGRAIVENHECIWQGAGQVKRAPLSGAKLGVLMIGGGLSDFDPILAQARNIAPLRPTPVKLLLHLQGYDDLAEQKRQ